MRQGSLILCVLLCSSVASAGKPVLQIWTAPDRQPPCPPCVSLARDWRANPQFRSQVESRFDVRWIHFDQWQQQAISQGITRIPTFEIVGVGKFANYWGPQDLLLRLDWLSRQPPSSPPAPQQDLPEPSLPEQPRLEPIPDPQPTPADRDPGSIDLRPPAPDPWLTPQSELQAPPPASPPPQPEPSLLQRDLDAIRQQLQDSIAEQLKARSPPPALPAPDLGPAIPWTGSNTPSECTDGSCPVPAIPSSAPSTVPAAPSGNLLTWLGKAVGTIGPFTPLGPLAIPLGAGLGLGGWVLGRLQRRRVTASSPYVPRPAVAPGPGEGPVKAPFPRELDEACQLLKLRQSEGRVGVLDQLRGMLLDDESPKLLRQLVDPAAQQAVQQLLKRIDERVSEIAPLTTRTE